MAYWISAHLFSALCAGVVALIILYFVPRERVASNKATTTIEPTHREDRTTKWRLGLTLGGLAIYGLISLIFSVIFLVFLYGIVVIVFRYAFGIELPFGRFN